MVIPCLLPFGTAVWAVHEAMSMFQRFTSIIGSVAGSDAAAPSQPESQDPNSPSTSPLPSSPLLPTTLDATGDKSSTSGVLETLNKKIFEFGDPGEELDPVTKLGVNAEGVVESLGGLSTSIGRLLNQSGYSGPLEGIVNAHLDRLEALAKSQLQLVKIEGSRSERMAKEIESLRQRLQMEEDESLSLLHSRKELEAVLIRALSRVEERVLHERTVTEQLFDALKLLRKHNETLVSEQEKVFEQKKRADLKLETVQDAYKDVTDKYLALCQRIDESGLSSSLFQPSDREALASPPEAFDKFDLLNGIEELISVPGHERQEATVNSSDIPPQPYAAVSMTPSTSSTIPDSLI